MGIACGKHDICECFVIILLSSFPGALIVLGILALTIVVVKFYRDRITENTSPVDEADQIWSDNPLYFDMEEVINDREYNDTKIDIGQELDKEEEAENDMNQLVENQEDKEQPKIETNQQKEANMNNQGEEEYSDCHLLNQSNCN